MKVLVLVKSLHPYWNEVELGVKAAAKKYNLEATFSAFPKEDSAEQIAIIEDFISKGGEGLAFAVSVLVSNKSSKLLTMRIASSTLDLRILD